MTLRGVLVADSPGHILERIAKTYADYGTGVDHDYVCSSIVPPYAIRRAGEKADILHWIDPLAFAAYPNAARVPQLVMVHHLTDPEIEPMIRSLHHADGLVTSSRRWQQRLSDMTRRPVDLIPYTVDVSVFQPIDDIAGGRSALGIGPGEFVIGYSGKAAANAYGRKGIDTLFEIFKESASRWKNLAIILIGSGWEDLSEALRSLGVRVVRWEPATTEETASIYPLMDVLVSTSREEGGPCTIMEAMACEVPIITTDVGHVPELIVDGENGFVCTGTNPWSAFVEKIECLRGDNELRAHISQNGRRTVLEQRDPRVVIPRIDFNRIYKDAQARYALRTSREKATRFLGLSVLGGRYLARLTQRRLSRITS